MKVVMIEKRNTAFDLLKVLFLLLIIIHHCGVLKFHESFYLGVDLFFIISGYLLYSSYERQEGTGTLILIKKRLRRLYPPYLWALISFWFFYLFTRHTLPYKKPICFVYELLLLQNIGLPNSGGLNYPCWYISVLMLSTIVFYLLWNRVKGKNMRIIMHLSLAVVIYIAMFANNSSTIEQWGRIANLLYIPLLRGLAGMSVGVVFRLFGSSAAKFRYLDVPLLVVSFLAMLTNVSEYITLVLVALLVYSATVEQSILQRIGNTKCVGFLIEHEYTMFLNHALIIRVLAVLVAGRVSKVVYCIIVIMAVAIYSIFLDVLGKTLVKFSGGIRQLD